MEERADASYAHLVLNDHPITDVTIRRVRPLDPPGHSVQPRKDAKHQHQSVIAHDTITTIHGDALEVLRTMPDQSVHAIVTDPPYGLAEHKPGTISTAIAAWVGGDREHAPVGRGFMGKAWDAFVPPPAVWDECLRVLKPGGHMLCFAAARTVDLMGLAIRLAGFEIRDSITWMYATGFPKSLDVSKAIDKAAGVEREVIGTKQAAPGCAFSSHGRTELDLTAPATAAAMQWSGWGTGLKPASEPIIVARKPLAGTVAATVLEHSTGALNIDGCRVGTGTGKPKPLYVPRPRDNQRNAVYGAGLGGNDAWENTNGRWPANVVLAHNDTCTADECANECPVAELDRQSGTSTSRTDCGVRGGAGRYFPVFRYQAKAPSKERPTVEGRSHPTVKPLTLMRWLVKLVTPPGGVVLDPFAGSGTTGQAADLEGFTSVLVERDLESVRLIAARLDAPDSPIRRRRT